MNKKQSLIVTIIGGWFGLHKFLNKKIGMGIIYLCTCGLFCIGWFYDIYIAFKKYKGKGIKVNHKSNYVSGYVNKRGKYVKGYFRK